MHVFVFGNGNLSFNDYLELYYDPLLKVIDRFDPHFIVCEFRGVDTLTLELFKGLTPKVTVLHIGEKPRYMADQFKTHVGSWNIKGEFINDTQRDLYAINSCTHFLAYDFNSDNKRKSGTLKNIEACIEKNKIDVKTIL